VTSVAVTTSTGILSITGSPITSSGDIVLGFATEPANTIFAGPTSGGSGTPTFRALVGADFGSISASDLSNGVTGSGAIVLATSPVLVTPALGTPVSGNLANTTGYVWNNLSNPTGSLTLSMGTFTTTFNYTSGSITFANSGNITAAGNITATSGGITATSGNLTITAGNIIVTAGTITASGNITSTAGNLIAGALVLTASAPTVSASQLGLGATTAATATAGSATLPANPVGFLIFNLAGTTIKVPYYAV
jgi:hypothetical protein